MWSNYLLTDHKSQMETYECDECLILNVFYSYSGEDWIGKKKKGV